ncbi:ribosome-binding protein 1-like [Salvia splendens]|uniref:ribosome-binding protein 1-like n=1 Tax=Salvia splendens TaxID=180675 RepID=UPI001C25C4B6|nr:ribosome-binding protein 1-like [Salvia splendens]
MELVEEGKSKVQKEQAKVNKQKKGKAGDSGHEKSMATKNSAAVESGKEPAARKGKGVEICAEKTSKPIKDVVAEGGKGKETKRSAAVESGKEPAARKGKCVEIGAEKTTKPIKDGAAEGGKGKELIMEKRGAAGKGKGKQIQIDEAGDVEGKSQATSHLKKASLAVCSPFNERVV